MYWREEDPGRLTMYVGCFAENIAVVEKSHRGKMYTAWHRLPGLYPTKPYGPREQMISEVERQVAEWFALANTWRPAGEAEDAE